MKNRKALAVWLVFAALLAAMLYTLWGVSTGKIPTRHGYGRAGFAKYSPCAES